MSPEIFGVFFTFVIIARSMSYPIEGNDNGTFSSIPCSTDDSSGGSYTEVGLVGRNGIINEDSRWKELKVYVDPLYKYEYVKLIKSALDRLQKAVPCLPITLLSQNEITYGADYVYVIDDDNCWSNIGRKGGRQELSLAMSYCMSEATIIHEFIHALGFRHEQGRADRDKYVEIHYKNITPGRENNFRKMNPDDYGTFDVSYNENSIMHYGSTSFSKNGRATITSKRKITVGSKGYMQKTDVERLRRMYGCRL